MIVTKKSFPRQLSKLSVAKRIDQRSNVKGCYNGLPWHPQRWVVSDCQSGAVADVTGCSCNAI